MSEEEGLIGKAWKIQRKIEAKINQIGKGKYGRVLKMARKPDTEEYSRTSKITGLGILLIGGLGFVIYILSTVVAPWIAKSLGLGP
jgi:protein transport protein SEC61 subunit gamma-like protein